jgi:hypothetical protein
MSLIYHRHKTIDSINSWARNEDMFPVGYGQIYRVELSFK